MKFTNTKKKAEDTAKQEYINNAPLSEKKRKTTNVTIAINEKEREMLDNYLETTKNETGRKISRSTFFRNCAMENIKKKVNVVSEDVWGGEPFTIAEASLKFNVPEETITSALNSGRFMKNEAKILNIKQARVWVVTRNGMERVFNRIK